jgi:predicted nucleic-acid-binding Zn-ribbon protein
MSRLYQGILLTIAAGLSICLDSCTLKSCFDVTESQVNAGFYSKETGKPLSPDSLTLYGMNMDTSKIYNKVLAPKTAQFPLFAPDTSVKFIIQINGIYDTIEFRYSSYLHLISKECGYTYYYNLDTALHSFNIIDSLSFSKKTITTLSEENMRIYY